MRYVISTTWKHDDAIDEASMKAYLAESKLASDEDGIAEVYWFKIDDHTHGSVLVYVSEDAYVQHQEKLKVFRNAGTGVSLMREEKGPSIAVLSEL